MRVLMVGNSKNVKGGITTVISQFCDFDWNSVHINFKFIPTFDGGNGIHKIVFFAQAFLKIKKEIQTNKLDWLHIHMSMRGSFERTKILQKLAQKYEVKVLIHLHGSEFEKWYNQVSASKQKKIQKVLKNADEFVVLGKGWEECIHRIEPSTKTMVIPNSVSIPESTAKWNENHFTLLYLGILHPRKRVSDIIQALANLNNDKIKLVIAGSGTEENRLKQQVRNLGVENQVTYTGWVEEEGKQQLMLESQALVLVSENEGLPMAVLEAMSYALPIVATDVGDLNEAVYNGKNGYLVSPGDLGAIEYALRSLVESDEKEWQFMSNESRKIAEEKFSAEKYFENFVWIYRSKVKQCK